MTLANVNTHWSKHLTVQTDSENVDWTEALPNTRKLFEVDLSGGRRVSVNPELASEVVAAHDDGDEYTMTVKGAPWEMRGTIELDEDQHVYYRGGFSVYVPTDPDAVDWGDDVGGTRNIVQVTLNGADPWEFQLNPAFRDDFARGLQQGPDDYDEAEVLITIDDESPWRIKSGQITIENDDGEWVVRSSPLMIAADELDWEFSFEEWGEE